MQTKYIIFGEALINRVKKFIQNLPENYSKGAKIAITASKFLKFPGEHAPSLDIFLFFNELQIIILPKKNTLEKCGN